MHAQAPVCSAAPGTVARRCVHATQGQGRVHLHQAYPLPITSSSPQPMHTLWPSSMPVDIYMYDDEGHVGAPCGGAVCVMSRAFADRALGPQWPQPPHSGTTHHHPQPTQPKWNLNRRLTSTSQHSSTELACVCLCPDRLSRPYTQA